MSQRRIAEPDAQNSSQPVACGAGGPAGGWFDRGPYGEFLTEPQVTDPWRRSKRAICNQWYEWEGMRDVVAHHKWEPMEVLQQSAQQTPRL